MLLIWRLLQFYCFYALIAKLLQKLRQPKAGCLKTFLVLFLISFRLIRFLQLPVQRFHRFRHFRLLRVVPVLREWDQLRE